MSDCEVVLTLVVGMRSNHFDYLTAPPSEMMVRSLEFLFSLGALDDYGRLTRPLGIQMAEVPVDPMLAKIVSLTYIAIVYHVILADRALCEVA